MSVTIYQNTFLTNQSFQNIWLEVIANCVVTWHLTFSNYVNLHILKTLRSHEFFPFPNCFKQLKYMADLQPGYNYFPLKKMATHDMFVCKYGKCFYTQVQLNKELIQSVMSNQVSVNNHIKVRQHIFLSTVTWTVNFDTEWQRRPVFILIAMWFPHYAQLWGSRSQ